MSFSLASKNAGEQERSIVSELLKHLSSVPEAVEGYVQEYT